MTAAEAPADLCWTVATWVLGLPNCPQEAEWILAFLSHQAHGRHSPHPETRARGGPQGVLWGAQDTKGRSDKARRTGCRAPVTVAVGSSCGHSTQGCASRLPDWLALLLRSLVF